MLVTASHVFLGPMPIKEKSSPWPFTLSMATALLETASGSGSTPGSAAANKNPRKASNRSKCLFMESNLKLDALKIARMALRLPDYKSISAALGWTRLECWREIEQLGQIVVACFGCFSACLFRRLALGGNHSCSGEHYSGAKQGDPHRQQL